MAVPSRVVLPALLLVSGFCGISYEILYTKLLGNLLGNHFTISATVLLTFLLGIGLGTLWAYRFVRWLWAIEAGIGLYAAVMVGAYGWIEALLYEWVPALGTSLVACGLVSIALLAVPAFLVGCSVPLFAAYLGTLRTERVFSSTYAIYNLGAALTALTLEFALLHVVGLRVATLLLAGLNIVVALGLLLLVRTTPIVPPPRTDRLHFAGRDLGALALVSIASAVFQLLMIKVAEFVFGPYNETFALVLAVVLLGIAVGSFATGRLSLTFSGAVLLALTGLASIVLLFPTAVGAYAALYPSAVKSYPLLVSLKLSLVLLVMGLPAVGFGATVPALLRTHRDVARESGQLLFVSSLANVVGFVLMAFVLHEHFDYGPLLVVVAVVSLAGLFLHAGPRRAGAWVAVALTVLVLTGQRTTWSEALLYYGHTNFHSTRQLEVAKDREFSAERFKGRRDVFAIIRRDGRPYFFINGYVSIPLSSASEKIVGALSSLFAPRTDKALVLGVGSGATAGSVGLIFDRTDAVEINPVILENLYRMAEYNFDIENMESVDIVNDDGIHFVKTTPERYSLILNTVTTPLYFSSSKLYTKDFLEDVVRALAPDGVYTTWVDRKIGDRGVDIILGTLESVFEECWLTYLKSSYYLLVCSNEEIEQRQLEAVTGNDRLRSYLADEHALPVDLIPYGILSTDAIGLRADPSAVLNTLDFPSLEHEMARLDGETRLIELRQRLIDRLELTDVQRALGGTMDWSPGAFAFWGDLRLKEDSTLAEVLNEVVPRRFGDFTEGYKRAASRFADEVGTARAYFTYGHRLYERRLCSAAIPALSRALELDPSMHRAHYYLGRCHERQGDDPLARSHFREALRIDPDFEKAQNGLERLGEPGGQDG